MESEILPLETPAEVLLQQGFKGIIISGGNFLFSVSLFSIGSYNI